MVHGRGATDKERKLKGKNHTAGHMSSPRTWTTIVVRVTINTRTTRTPQHSTTTWEDQNTYVDPSKILADLNSQTEAEERQYLV